MNWKVYGVAAGLFLLGTTNSAHAQTFEPTGEISWKKSGAEHVRLSHRLGRRQADDGDYEGLGPRPRRWCGWWMRKQRGGGPEYNVAWNWRHWGSPTEPQVGAIVVWRHHVGEIVGRTDNGQWIVRSGNDGGRVRERPRSVAGALFRM